MQVGPVQEAVFGRKAVKGSSMVDLLNWLTTTTNPSAANRPGGLDVNMREIKHVNMHASFITNA